MPVALSNETLVNTTTAGAQNVADVAVLADGSAVVAWLDDSDPNYPAGKFRVMGADGTPIGNERSLGGVVADIAVAGLEDGGYAVAWTTKDPLGGVSVFSLVIDATGRPGRVVTLQESKAEGPILGRAVRDLEVAGLSDGGFAVTWTNSSFDSSGRVSVSAVVSVNGADGQVEGGFNGYVGGDRDTLTTPEGTAAQLADGRILFTWSVGSEQRAQLLDQAGNRLGGEFVIGRSDFMGTTDFLGYDGSDIGVLPRATWPRPG